MVASDSYFLVCIYASCKLKLVASDRRAGRDDYRNACRLVGTLVVMLAGLSDTCRYRQEQLETSGVLVSYDSRGDSSQ